MSTSSPAVSVERVFGRRRGAGFPDGGAVREAADDEAPPANLDGLDGGCSPRLPTDNCKALSSSIMRCAWPAARCAWPVFLSQA